MAWWQNLNQLESAFKSCRRCGLRGGCSQVVVSRGTPGPVVLVGEAPGADEDAQGFPFVGRAGQLLDRMLKEAGFDPARLYITNAVKCRPPGNRKPAPEEMVACRPYLMAQFAVLQPEIVVTMGATAIQAVLGRTIPVGRASTRFYHARHREREFLVAPCYHPSAILRDPRKYSDAVARWVDIRKRVEAAGLIL